MSQYSLEWILSTLQWDNRSKCFLLWFLSRKAITLLVAVVEWYSSMHKKVPLTTSSVVTRTNAITLFPFPSCDNFLHLTLYIKFLAFILVKTIYKKPKLLKFPTWNHFNGRHLLKMAWKEQHDGSHHYLSRFISLHHSVVHPPSHWQF